MTTRTYPFARVINVHDGDTIRLDVDLGFSTHAYVWIRLQDVGAPELKEAGGPEAKRVVEEWLATHAPSGYVTVMTQQVAGALKEIKERMTFIRYVGLVTTDDGGILNWYLRDQGYIDQGM
jgi:endonuclease YncB( thermonuclease family)